MDDQLNERITPTPADIVTMRSKAIDALSKTDASASSLLEQLAPRPSPGLLEVAATDNLGDVLGSSHEMVTAVRNRNAAITALHQLKGERVVQESPVGFPLRFAEIVTRNRSGSSSERGKVVAEPLGMHIAGPNQPTATLQLTSRSRGWTSADHGAFALSSCMVRPSSRLVTPDGELVLEEALGDFRLGQFMSCGFMLGAFAETAWMHAAQLCAPTDSDVSEAVSKAQPTADRVMTTVLDFLAPKPYEYARKQLEPWVRSTLATRNIIGHANLVGNRTGSFTEVSTAVRMIDTYRNLDDLDEALRRRGL